MLETRFGHDRGTLAALSRHLGVTDASYSVTPIENARRRAKFLA